MTQDSNLTSEEDVARCDCSFTKRNEKGEVIQRGCNSKAVKMCKHKFKTCEKHWHGCKGERSE